MDVDSIRKDGVAILTLNRPPANALSPDLLNGLRGAFVDALAADDVRAIVIAASGKLFSAGADLKVLASAGPSGQGQIIDLGQEVFEAIAGSPKPTVAALHGSAFGGGLELAMCCDLRVGGDGARFGQPEVNLGVLPGWGGTQRLPRLIGRTRALELLLTGDTLTAEQALAYGLLNRVAPTGDVLGVAQDLAVKFGGMSGPALRRIKEVVRLGEEGGLSAGLMGERLAFTELLQVGEGQEGIAAFLQKRRPRWRQ